MFSQCYITILSGNLLIHLTIRGSHHSEQPMYFFPSYLSFMDVCFTSMVAPKLMTKLLAQWRTISYNDCMAQNFYAHFFGTTEILMLVPMIYDHYEAICRLLHYIVIINRQLCFVLVMTSIIKTFIHSIIHLLIIIEPPILWPQSDRPLFM